MPETHDAPQVDLHLGPVRVFVHSLFVHKQRFPPRWQALIGPVVEFGDTFEDEPPWRDGHCIVVRIPFTRRGFAIGYWDLPVEGRVAPAFLGNGALLPFSSRDVSRWRRPTEVTDQRGTAFEDSKGVVTSHDVTNVVAWPGPRA